MSKIKAIILAVIVAVVLAILFLTAVLGKKTTGDVGETYDQLTVANTLETEINIDENSDNYYDAEYYFRQYIHDQGIEEGVITLDSCEINPGNRNLTISGTYNGEPWVYEIPNTEKE